MIGRLRLSVRSASIITECERQERWIPLNQSGRSCIDCLIQSRGPLNLTQLSSQLISLPNNSRMAVPPRLRGKTFLNRTDNPVNLVNSTRAPGSPGRECTIIAWFILLHKVLYVDTGSPLCRRRSCRRPSL